VFTGKETIVIDTDDEFLPNIEVLKQQLQRNDIAVVIVNSPNNPTGAVYPESVMRQIAEAIKPYPKVGKDILCSYVSLQTALQL
jgi:aspartate/methionine/tyrosine aminotransferase